MSSIELHPISSTHFALSCISHTSPPTQVTWERDGVELDTSGGLYTLTQTLVNRRKSVYNTTLVIAAGEEGAIGEYSCTVNNTLGTSNTLTRSVAGTC